MIRQLIILILFFLPIIGVSQDKEDPAKMFRDVVNVEVDRAKYGTKPAPAVTATVDPKAKKKKVEEPPQEVVDTLPPMMPAPANDILKRAQAWYISKATKYVKSNGSNSGKSVSCNASFIFKQKELNPENDVDGKITMDVIIDAKEGKFRYTIKNIKHVANKQGMSGGDIYAKVPECGSMSLGDRTWKHIKAEAFIGAQIIIDELKVKMKEEVVSEKEEW